MSIRRPDDDELERLLAGAEWPELEQPAAAEAVERLERAWHELRQVELARRKPATSWWAWAWLGSVAAAVAIAASVLMLRSLPEAEQQEQAARPKHRGAARATLPVEQATAEQPRSEQPVDNVPLAENPKSASPKSAEPLVREPNTYERVLLLARARAARAEAEPLVAADQTEREIVTGGEARGASPEELALDRLLASRSPLAAARFLSLVAEPTQREAALAALKRAQNPPIDDLAAFLDDPRRPVRLAAAHALSTLDDARAVERLSQSVGGIGRQEALMALLASRSPRASELVDAARQDVYLMASVRAAEQQLLTLQTENGENLP